MPEGAPDEGWSGDTTAIEVPEFSLGLSIDDTGTIPGIEPVSPAAPSMKPSGTVAEGSNAGGSAAPSGRGANPPATPATTGAPAMPPR